MNGEPLTEDFISLAALVYDCDLVNPPLIVGFRAYYNFIAFIFRQRKASIINANPSVLLRHKSSNKIV
jgi:hypothetical protein